MSETIPAKLSKNDKPMKYHFLPIQSIFGLRKNSMNLLYPSGEFPTHPRPLRSNYIDTGWHEKFPDRAGQVKINQILSLACRGARARTQSNITRDTKTPVNRFAPKPMVSVTANPFTGPVPNRKRKKAAMM